MVNDAAAELNRVRRLFRERFTFQISVDTAYVQQGLAVAEAALKAGVTIRGARDAALEIRGRPQRCADLPATFPQGVAARRYEDHGWRRGRGERGLWRRRQCHRLPRFGGRGDGQSGVRGARHVPEADPAIPRLAFADVLIPMQGPAGPAVRGGGAHARAGVDGVGIHLQYDARRADPALFQGSYLHDVACAVFESVGDRASVQVVGGLSAEQAVALARKGLRAFVISGNLGLPDAKSRYGLPGDEIERHIRDFIDQVSAAG